MLRRFLCLGAVLLALVLGAAGCGQNKTRNTVPVVPKLVSKVPFVLYRATMNS